MTGSIEIKTVDDKVQDFADIVFVLDGQLLTAAELFKLAASGLKDKGRLDFLQQRSTRISLDDGRIIEAGLLDVREVIDYAQSLADEEWSDNA